MTARLVALGAFTLAFNLGGGVIAPALPLYARSLGADYRDLGLIGASHGLAFAALTIPLGRASDRLGRRGLLAASALTVGGAAILYLTSGGVLGLAVGKLVEAAGWAAFWPALEAYVAEHFGRRAGAAMGLGYGAYAAAFVLGGALAGFLVEAGGLRLPFVLYLGTAALAALLVLTLSGAPPAAVSPTASLGDPGGRWDAAGARGQRLIAYGTGFVYVYGLGTVLAFLPVYASDRGLSPREVGVLLAGYWVARLLASLSAGRLSDRLGRRAVLRPAMLIAVVAAALMAAPGSPWLLAVGTVALGLTSGSCAPACIGLIADHVRAADRGMAMGLFEASCGLSVLVSGLVGGLLAEAFGGVAPYLLVSGLSLGWFAALVYRPPAGLPRPRA